MWFKPQRQHNILREYPHLQNRVSGNRISGNRTSEITLCGSRLKDHATSVLLQRLKDRSFHRNRQTRRTVANYRSQGRWNRVGGRGMGLSVPPAMYALIEI